MQHHACIHIQANQVLTHGDGIFTIEIPVQELSPGTAKIIDELFPNTKDQVFDLLNREALLASIAPASLVRVADEKRTAKQGYESPPEPIAVAAQPRKK